MVMGGIYVHETLAEPYATQIVTGKKTVETRGRDMLKRFVGKRVLVIRTTSKHGAEIIGSVEITGKGYWNAQQLAKHRDKTCIPEGSKYDTGASRWAYTLENPIELEPIPLKDVAVLHRTLSYAFVSFERRNEDVR